jgi:molybdate transport system substrate-binding protein
MSACLLALLLLAAGRPVLSQTVYAAASLSSALQEVVQGYAGEVRFSFASSSFLARQIEAGAPADLFVSANREWMDYLQEKGLLEAGTRADLLGNSLVVIAPKGQGFPVRLERDFAFATSFAGRLALADPDHVPAGQYARQALEKLGWWKDLQDRLAPALDARAALVFVERGECPAGMVYATDAAISNKVDVLATLPDSLHAPIVYPMAAIQGRDREEVRRLLDLFGAPEAAAVFARHGFRVLERGEKGERLEP